MLISGLDKDALRPVRPSSRSPYRSLPQEVLYLANKYGVPVVRSQPQLMAPSTSDYEFPGDLTNAQKKRA